jgi:membrane associated rhomboid family serine protease
MANYPPQRRPPPPSWMRPLTERLTPTVRGIVVALTLVYFFFVLAPALDPWIAAHLLLGPRLWAGELWQPATALVVNTHFSGWLFGLIGFWWVGAFVERIRGKRFFLGVLLAAGMLANVAAALVARSIGDFSPRADAAGFALTAVFVAFARIYGPRPAQIWGAFSMRADTFTWMLLGFSLVVSLANRDWPGLAAEVVAIAVGFVATGVADGVLARFRQGARARKLRRYRVLEGGKDNRRNDLN